MEPLQVHLTSIHCVSTVMSYVMDIAKTFDPYFPFKSPHFYPTLKIHQSLKYSLNSPDLSLEDPVCCFTLSIASMALSEDAVPEGRHPACLF